MSNYRLSIFVFLVLVAVQSYAQNPLDTLTFREFEIQDTKVSVEKPYKKQLLDSVILDHYQQGKLSELLQNETPIFVKTYGSGSLATLSIRGTGASHAQLFWNGIAITSPILGLNDFALIPVSSFDEAEIHYGLSSLEDGSGGLGGSLQLNNTSNWQNKRTIQIEGGMGSFGSYNGNGRIDVGNTKFQLQSGISINTSRNDFEYTNIALPNNPVERQENGDVFQYTFNQQAFFKFNPANVLSIKYNYGFSSREIPKIVTATQASQKLLDNNFRGMLDWSRVKSKSMLTVKTAYLYEQLRYSDSTILLTSSYQIHSVRNQIRYKYDYSDWIIQGTFNNDIDHASSTNYANDITQIKNSAMLSLKKGFLDKLVFHALLREDRLGRNFSPLQPSVGFNYELLNGLSVKLNTARSYRFPSLNELYWDNGTSRGNLDLLPESGWNSEGGIALTNKRMDRVKIKAEATLFYSKINNWILWTPDSLTSTFWTTENKQKVENKGLEINLLGTYKWKEIRIRLSGFYNYTSSIDIASQKQLIYVPQHTYKANLSLQYKELEVRYVFTQTGIRFITTDNNWYMPAYALSNLSLGKSFIIKDNNLMIRLGINNLFNTDYQSIAWRPMPRRNYQLTLRYNLSK